MNILSQVGMVQYVCILLARQSWRSRSSTGVAERRSQIGFRFIVLWGVCGRSSRGFRQRSICSRHGEGSLGTMRAMMSRSLKDSCYSSLLRPRLMNWRVLRTREASLLCSICCNINININVIVLGEFNCLLSQLIINMSVKVGVRVRPFNKREEQLGAKLCVQMEGNSTIVSDTDGQKKTFHYDYSFWSHDAFRVDEQGYTHPIDHRYADQKRVYELIGSSILVNAWDGYNCCLFAYGQTGSGKSYSMIGYGANKGLIPIVCNSIFEKIKGNQDGTRSFEVKISMLEIYNESVRDLLSKSKKQQLKICQHKTLGVYVDGLEKHNVDSYEKIEKKIEEGSNNRSIASTLMNQSSSRSHTIVSISFVQKIQISMEQTSVKYSTIHLVDLAGSQCVAKTGADSKDRLRETAKINQSLTTLGRVIEILAENCGKKDKDKTFVPYRDSKLTFILRNALGGNSCTAMICAISPADDNFQQTLSTLRYASRAKKIQNRAIINQSDVDKLIRVLREQNEMLKKMLQQARMNKTMINEEMISNFNETKKILNMAVDSEEKREDKEEGGFLEELENGTNDDSSSNASINDSFSVVPINNNINEELPYLTNISEDQLLSCRVKYSCEKLFIGNKKGNPKPDVILTSLGIQPNHAFISYDSQSKKCYIQLLQQSATNYTFINGQTINSKTKEQIFHLDRIIFGTGCLFVLFFKNGECRPNNAQLKLEDIDYQFAMNEMQTSNQDKVKEADDKNGVLEEQELRKQIVQEIERDFDNIKKQKEEEMKKQIEEKEKEYYSKIKELEDQKEKESQKLLLELEVRKKQASKLQEQKEMIKQQVSRIEKQTKQRAKRQQHQKMQIQATKQTLRLKQQQILQLQNKMNSIKIQTQSKNQLVKVQIKKQEQQMKKQLELQTSICHNANIIEQYRLQVSKRMKNAKQLKELLIKKEKIQLQKQLVQLVPQVQRFNLMAKQMEKRLECGLSIEYKYISEAEIIEVLKNNTYKSKLKILIHVINRDEGRSYYWDTRIFQNRFQHALQYFQNYIQSSKNFKYVKEQDPYWDPQKFETVAHTHITLQFLMFNISFSGEIAIVSHGKKIGKIQAKVFQTDRNGVENNSIDEKAEKNQYKLINPHQQVEKTIYFILEFSHIEIIQGEFQEYDQLKMQYWLLDNYKMVRYETEVIPKIKVSSFKYRRLHIIKELSEASIIHFLEKPLLIDIQVIQRVATTDQLTHRSSFTSVSNVKSSFAYQLEEQELKPAENISITQFIEISPPKKSIKLSSSINTAPVSPLRQSLPSVSSGIYQNTDITKRVEEEYQKKKKEQLNNASMINMKKNKQSVVGDSKSGKKDAKNPKQCEIY